MSGADSQAVASHPSTRRTAIQRLLFVADAAAADVDELPPAVRAVIHGAAKVYVSNAVVHHADRPTLIIRHSLVDA